eukprot:Phypoly_transcript_04501.p1 GENE.Phypoly_transcript_04501~~Phypoly_transcript_04501.p1  ORF type:complete len:638 (+),score=74.01 Phypoly_transcript_04501:124-2037(+)
MTGVPDIPDALKEHTERYQHSRSAVFADWVPSSSALNGGMLILTRFAETTQVHHVQRAGGARKQLTFFKDAVVRPKFCPNVSFFDGFFFLKDHQGNEFYQIYSYNIKNGEIKLLTDGKSKNDSILWSHSGDKFIYTTTERTGKDFDLAIRSGANLDKVESVVEAGGGLWTALSWSHDDKKVLVMRYKSINESFLHILDVGSKKLTQVNPTNEPVAYQYAKFDPTPGRNGLFLASDQNSDFSTLKYFDLDKNQFEPLTFKNAAGETLDVGSINWDVEYFDTHATDSGKTWVSFAVNEDGISSLYSLDLKDKIFIKHDSEMSVMSGLHFNHENKSEPSLAVVIDSPIAPADTYVLDVQKNKKEQWTFSEMGGLQQSMFSTPTLIKYPSFDRLQISAFVYRPKNADPSKKLPALLYIHGGPEMQSRPIFNSIFQYIVNELGIVLIIPNVRGSSGYGKQFLLLDNGYKREDSVKDIGALIDWVGQQPDMDSAKIGVYGRSYGGYMVLASLIHYGDRLKCGVEMVGISNWVTFLENTQAYRRDLRREEYGDERIPEMRKFLLEISPSTNAHKLTKPMYVSQGLNDPRVPCSESDQIIEAVRKNGREVWYVIAKDEGHGWTKKVNVDYHNNLMLYFLQLYLLK